jgi:hypothetical protein
MANSIKNIMENSTLKNKGRNSETNDTSCQCNSNLNHEEVIVLIHCKHKKHNVVKQTIDPRANIRVNTWYNGSIGEEILPISSYKIFLNDSNEHGCYFKKYYYSNL